MTVKRLSNRNDDHTQKRSFYVLSTSAFIFFILLNDHFFRSYEKKHLKLQTSVSRFFTNSRVKKNLKTEEASEANFRLLLNLWCSEGSFSPPRM